MSTEIRLLMYLCIQLFLNPYLLWPYLADEVWNAQSSVYLL